MEERYSELLKDPRWKQKRLEMLRKRNFKCESCHNEKPIKTYRNHSQLYVALEKYKNHKQAFALRGAGVSKVGRIVTGEFNEPEILILKPILLSINYYKCLASRPLTSSEKSYYTEGYVSLVHLKSTMTYKLKFLQMAKIGGQQISKINEQLFSLNLKFDLPKLPYLTPRKVVLSNNEIGSNWKVYHDMHVHHEYYKLDCFPWEYPDEALTVLCKGCHELKHK